MKQPKFRQLLTVASAWMPTPEFWLFIFHTISYLCYIIVPFSKSQALLCLQVGNLNSRHSGITGRGGQSAPQRLLTRKFLLNYQVKRGQEKREKGENWEEKKENCKREGWKLKGEGVKVTKHRKKVEDLFFFFVVVFFVVFVFVLFFFFCLSLFKTTKICFGSTKMEIFYWEKSFLAGKKIRKNDFAPSEKFSLEYWVVLAKKKKTLSPVCT